MIIPKNINEPFINLFSFGVNQDSQSHLRNFFLTFKIGLSQAAVAKTYVFWQGQHYWDGHPFSYRQLGPEFKVINAMNHYTVKAIDIASHYSLTLDLLRLGSDPGLSLPQVNEYFEVFVEQMKQRQARRRKESIDQQVVSPSK